MYKRAGLAGIVTIVLLLPVCSEAVEEVSFGREVMPILKRYCVICHLPDSAQGKLSLYPNAYENIVSMPSSQSPLLLVDPSSSKQSYLYHKLMGTQGTIGGTGKRMPYLHDSLSLDGSDLEIIRIWIEQGAKNN